MYVDVDSIITDRNAELKVRIMAEVSRRIDVISYAMTKLNVKFHTYQLC